MVKSATRTLDVLEALADAPDGLTHGDLSTRLDIPRSSVSGLLKSLAARHFAEIDPATNKWFLAHAVLGLSRSYLGRTDVVGRAGPLLSRLSANLNEACALTIRRNDDVVVVWKTDDPNRHRPSVSLQLGQSGPIFASASGKAMLAAEGPAAVKAYLDDVVLEPRTSGEVLERDALGRDLEETLATGIGFSRGEMFTQITAIGIAARGPDNKPVAGISVSLPSERAVGEHQAFIIKALRETEHEVSIRLGAAS